MYKSKDRQTKPLFQELFPFGGSLDEENRWFMIAELIPWNQLENCYSQNFSTTGRPGVDAQLAIGLLLLKHMTGTSDREIAQLVSENPFKRGKAGKDVEFGPKASLSHVGAFTFLDKLSSDNFNESGDAALQFANYEELFGIKPPYAVGDRIYGTNDNRKLLKDNKIRDAFEPRGRKPKDENTSDHRWRKRKRWECNRIEGAFGHFKNHLGLDRIKYSIEGGDELWIRLGLTAANLKTAVANM